MCWAKTDKRFGKELWDQRWIAADLSTVSATSERVVARMIVSRWLEKEKYSSLLVAFGFSQGMGFHNCFSRKERWIMTSVHGGNFTSCNSKRSLDWREWEIAKKY